jgi:hypothetical protein
MLSNFDLEQLAKKYDVKLNAVSSKDTIPHPLENGWYIINLQNLGEGSGTHWVSLLYDKNESVYFDSFGVIYPLDVACSVKHTLKPETYIPPQELKNAIRIYNQKQIQHLTNDNNCGLYCISLMCFFKQCGDYMLNESKLRCFQNMFSINTQDNQYILRNFLSSYYNNDRHNKKLVNDN